MATKPTRTHVEVSTQEQLLIFKSYKSNKCNWPAIFSDVKREAHVLPERARALYEDGRFDKVKRRMSDQVSKLKLKNPLLIQNDELRALVEEVATDERRYSTKAHPNAKRPKPKEKNNSLDSIEDNDKDIPLEEEDAPPAHQVEDNVIDTPLEEEDAPPAHQVEDNDRAMIENDHRRQAIPLADDDQEVHNNGQRKRRAEANEEPAAAGENETPRKKSTTELARQAYEQYIQSQESAKKLEEKMSKCMDKFLSM